jgi:hypothetical protein
VIRSYGEDLVDLFLIYFADVRNRSSMMLAMARSTESEAIAYDITEAGMSGELFDVMGMKVFPCSTSSTFVLVPLIYCLPPCFVLRRVPHAILERGDTAFPKVACGS